MLCKSYDKNGWVWKVPILTEILFTIHEYTCKTDGGIFHYQWAEKE